MYAWFPPEAFYFDICIYIYVCVCVCVYCIFQWDHYVQISW